MRFEWQKARTGTVLTLSLGVLILDQLTKEWARRVLAGSGRHEFLNGLVLFEHAENPGAFLSVGADLHDNWRFLLFSVGVIFVLIWAAWLLFLKPGLHRFEVWGLSLLFGGGAGNLIDRLSKSSVTDFVQMGAAPLQTGVFNVADMAILAGVFLMLAASFANKKKTPSTNGVSPKILS